MADLLLNSAVAAGAGEWKARAAGIYAVVADGTWGGTTLTLEYKGPKGNAIAITGVSISANGLVTVTLPAGQYRAVLTGGAAMNLSVALVLAGNC